MAPESQVAVAPHQRVCGAFHSLGLNLLFFNKKSFVEIHCALATEERLYICGTVLDVAAGHNTMVSAKTYNDITGLTLGISIVLMLGISVAGLAKTSDVKRFQYQWTSRNSVHPFEEVNSSHKAWCALDAGFDC